ncbi:hypothetical protein Tco_0616974, partial [Tanacetum coccineum]
ESVTSDVNASLKTIAGNSVSMDLRSRTTSSYQILPYLAVSQMKTVQ